MKAKIHAAAGALALLLILSFWTATVISELSQDLGTITAVKAWMLNGVFLLIPVMAIAGGSGLSLGKGWKSAVVARKRVRMKIVAANGLLVLVPSAVFLAAKAEAGAFDWTFAGVQGVELLAGAVNMTLLALNMRDGLAMRRPRSARRSTDQRAA
jgi:hypothetical protein